MNIVAAVLAVFAVLALLGWSALIMNPASGPSTTQARGVRRPPPRRVLAVAAGLAVASVLVFGAASFVEHL